MKKPHHVRYLAALSIAAALKEDKKLSEQIEPYRKDLSPKDFTLLSELSYGTVRHWGSLEKIAKTVVSRLKLSKLEKAALFLGIYQLVCLDKIPDFAAIFETIEGIKKRVPQPKIAFIHSVLQKIKEGTYTIDPMDNYPQIFVEKIQQAYPDQAGSILESLMQRPTWFARKLGTLSCEKIENKKLSEYVADAQFYIQNTTPVELLSFLKDQKVDTILDLCCGVGGKLFLAADIFATADFFAVDVNPSQIKKLKDNLSVYQKQATVIEKNSLELAEDKKFDLVIVDVPCSNSGVFRKHPEAKWRFNEESLLELNQLQKALLDKAYRLTKPGGRVWYITCSILPEENHEICKNYPIIKEKTILPNKEGGDGGYGCCLQKIENKI